MKRVSARLGCAARAVAAIAFAAPAANAATATTDATPPVDVWTGETAAANETAATQQSCTAPKLATSLAAFGDRRSYFLAPGGNFEDAAAGWRLEGGAKVVAGNEPFGVVAVVARRSACRPAPRPPRRRSASTSTTRRSASSRCSSSSPRTPGSRWT